MHRLLLWLEDPLHSRCFGHQCCYSGYSDRFFIITRIHIFGVASILHLWSFPSAWLGLCSIIHTVGFNFFFYQILCHLWLDGFVTVLLEQPCHCIGRWFCRDGVGVVSLW